MEYGRVVPALAPPSPPLSDGVVALRGWRDADVPAIAAMMDEPEIARYTRAPSPYTERDALQWRALHPVMLRRNEALPLAIADAADTRLLGSIELRFRPEGRGELGYLLAREARGRGVATRALRLFARWAFEWQGLKRLEAHVQPDNVPSLALAERVGFRREGVMRSYSVMRGERVDLVLLAMLPGELRED